MSLVYTRIQGVPAISRDKRIYGSGTSFTSVINAPPVAPPSTTPPTVITPTDVISFTANKTPSLFSYATLYSPTHGQFPRITLITLDASNNRIERSEKPKYIMTLQDGTIDDTISSITFTLAKPETGFIIIQ